MPDSDTTRALTTVQLTKLRQRLLAEQTRLQGSATISLVREGQERSADEMDEAEASLVQHEALGRASHDQSHLAEIQRALARIEAGTYGVSELSGSP
jgi:DnaK suppressor protein